MGFVDFMKDVGEKLWDKIANQESKSDKLEQHLKQLGLDAIKGSDIKVDGDTVTINGEVTSQADKEKILLALGNVEGIAKVEDHIKVTQPAEEATFYTVQSGDNLSMIAKKVYGNANAYMTIFEANKPMLKHPDKIYPGQVLRIPQKK